jgi:predicted NAD-dependent protein-ADP-ribosyltransferase YbiA (DUF1768 family)
MQFHSRSANPTARVLSNFYPIPVYQIPCAPGVIPNVLWDRSAPTVEHAFQAVKVATAKEASEGDREKLLTRLLDGTTTPTDARTMGGKRSFKQSGLTLNPDQWNAVSTYVMRMLLEARFRVDPDFRKALLIALKQGVPLHFERSGAKSKWGGCFNKATGMWQGENQLGRILYELPKNIECEIC